MSVKFTFKALFSSLILAGFLLVIGCQQKQAEPVKKEEPAAQQQPAQAPKDTVKPAAAEKPAPTIDLKGTWTGKFDINAATLKITAQDGNKFSGKINVKQRVELNQDVSGQFNGDKLTFTMKDMIHARSMGTYAGTISKDNKSLNGTFSMTFDKVKVKFSFSKK